MADLNKQRINRIAAGMAVSNMGLLGLHLTVEQLLRWKPSERYDNTPRSEVEDFAGSLMESNEHEVAFAGEAEWWAEQITTVGIPAFAEQYYHHADWIMQLNEVTP